MDSFMINHQSSLDSQREEDELRWLFPDEYETELEDDEDFFDLLDLTQPTTKENEHLQN